jgi:hypothetical protein
MNTKDLTLIVALALTGWMSACATVAPAQLVGARESYTAATIGLAGTMGPTALSDAKRVLDEANKEFEARGNTTTCRDYAYIAQNKLELADVTARTELDRRTISEVATAANGAETATVLISAESPAE